MALKENNRYRKFERWVRGVKAIPRTAFLLSMMPQK
jgi:hypothetical protein